MVAIGLARSRLTGVQVKGGVFVWGSNRPFARTDQQIVQPCGQHESGRVK